MSFQAFFKELEPYKTFFAQVKKSGKFDGEFLPGPQMDSLALRLQTMDKGVPVREKRLGFEEYKHRAMGVREATEARLQRWTDKLGPQEEVEQLLAEYQVWHNRDNNAEYQV